MSDTGGYIHKREGYILCVHCSDHIPKGDLIEIRENELTLRMQSRTCARSLPFALKQGPAANGDN